MNAIFTSIMGCHLAVVAVKDIAKGEEVLQVMVVIIGK